MKIITTYLILCLAASQLPAQDIESRKLYNSAFRWSITIPENFESVSSEEWEKLQNKGAQAIENTYGEAINDRPNTIFVFKSGKNNYFESNAQPFDPARDGDYDTVRKAVNEVLYETFKSQIPDVVLDSSSSVETVSGLDFHKFTLNARFKTGLTMTALMFTRLFDDQDFSVNIMYIDEAAGKKMIEAWMTSVFD